MQVVEDISVFRSHPTVAAHQWEVPGCRIMPAQLSAHRPMQHPCPVTFAIPRARIIMHCPSYSALLQETRHTMQNLTMVPEYNGLIAAIIARQIPQAGKTSANLCHHHYTHALQIVHRQIVYRQVVTCAQLLALTILT